MSFSITKNFQICISHRGNEENWNVWVCVSVFFFYLWDSVNRDRDIEIVSSFCDVLKPVPRFWIILYSYIYLYMYIWFLTVCCSLLLLLLLLDAVLQFLDVDLNPVECCVYIMRARFNCFTFILEYMLNV